MILISGLPEADSTQTSREWREWIGGLEYSKHSFFQPSVPGPEPPPARARDRREKGYRQREREKKNADMHLLLKPCLKNFLSFEF